MLCAFALPSVNGGPHEVPIGVTGPQAAAEGLGAKLDGPEWDVTVYEDTAALTTAIQEREVAGGLALGTGGIDVYTATAGAPTATGALTALGNAAADRQHVKATVHDLVPFPGDDPGAPDSPPPDCRWSSAGSSPPSSSPGSSRATRTCAPASPASSSSRCSPGPPSPGASSTERARWPGTTGSPPSAWASAWPPWP